MEEAQSNGTGPLAEHRPWHQFAIVTCSIINQTLALECHAISLAYEKFSLMPKLESS